MDFRLCQLFQRITPTQKTAAAMKLKPPCRWNVAKSQLGYEWKHQNLPEDPIYTRSFYELNGTDGLIFFLEDRYGKKFTRKATELLSF